MTEHRDSRLARRQAVLREQVGDGAGVLLGQHLETCVADAVRSGSSRDRQRKLDELLDVFSRFSGR